MLDGKDAARQPASMTRILAFILILLPLEAVAASGCEDIWFTRNLVMDRAGHCFSSPLGQAVFDNSDCTGTGVQPDAYGTQVIQQIRALEAQHACRVNTNQTWIDLPDIAFRKVLRTHPIFDEFEGGCLGWNGPNTPLYDGYSEPFHQIGQIQPGDFVSYGHLPVGEWTYVTIHTANWATFKSAGWLYFPGPDPCVDFAG